MKNQARKWTYQNMYIHILIYHTNSILLSFRNSNFAKSLNLSKSAPHLASKNWLINLILELLEFSLSFVLRLMTYPSIAQKASFNYQITQEGFIKFTKRSLTSYLIVSTLFVGTGLIYLFNPFIKEADAAWFNDNWLYRQEVPVTANTGVDTNTFISFSLNTATLLSADRIQSACQDIRVTDAGGNLLPYHVGRTNACNNAATTIDALVPTLATGASSFYVYYGNPSVASADAGAFSQSEAANYTIGSLGSQTKGPSPVAYWKFDAGQGTSAQDSTTNNNTGTISGAAWQTPDQCISNMCLWFDGSNDQTTVSNTISGTQTVAFWVKPNAFTSTTPLVDINGTAKITANSSGVISATSFTSPTIYVNGIVSSQLAANQWQYVTVTTGTGLNGTAIRIASDNTNFLKGFVDEVKIYNQALTAAQVTTNYSARSNPEGVAQQGGNNQNMPGTLSNGLIGYWKLDQTSGQTRNCTATPFTDSSGNGYNGASCPSTNGPDGGAVGKYAAAVTFDGTDDYISLPDLGLAGTGKQNISWSGWVNPTSASGTYSWFVYGNGTISSRLVGNGKIECEIRNDSGTLIQAQSTSTLSNATWAHVICTYDGQNVKIFLNGVLEGTTAQTGDIRASATDITDGYAIGNGFTGTTRDKYWAGRIDEVRTYNRTLSNNEALQLYNWAPAPIGYWKIDENTGTTAFDSSGSAVNGTLKGTASYKIAKFGSGVNLDGVDTTIDPHITLPNNTYDSSTQGSISVWFKPNDSGTNPQYLFASAETDGTDFLGLYFNPVTDVIGIFIQDNGTPVLLATAPLSSTTTWSHVEFIMTTTGNTLYINGIKQISGSTLTYFFGDATTDAWFDNVADNTTGYAIGCLQLTDQNTCLSDGIFNGIIDETKVYDYPRSPSQVLEDLNAGNPIPTGASNTQISGGTLTPAYGYWKFDEGADNTCPGGTNDACNSGNAGPPIDGAESNMAVPATATSGWTQNGRFGRALAFDGTDDFVSMGDISGTDSVTQATWSFWTKPGTLATQKCIWCKVNTPAGTPAQSSWAVMTDSSDSSIVRGIIANGAADVSQYGSTPTGTLVNGTWAYVAVVYNGDLPAAQRLQIYVNGKPVTTTITGTIPTSIRNSTANAVFGRASSDASALYTGTIDEPKLYLTALNAAQVMQDYNRGSTQVLGAMSNNSSYETQSDNQEYCVPGDATSCAGPVGRWDFEEGTGTTIYDKSGNGNALTWNGTTTNIWSNQGKIGKAGQFNGTDNYAEVNPGSSFNTQTPTIEAWFNTTTASYAPIVHKHTRWYLLYIGQLAPSGCTAESAGQISFMVQNSGSTNRCAKSTATFNDGKWHHAVGTYDGATVKVYVDGVLAGSTAAVVTLGGTNNNFRIGADSTPTYFPGKIDQVRVFNYVRTGAQVAWDYNQGKPLAHWKLDECQGTTLNDASGNGYSATLTIGGGGTYTTAGTCATSSASSSWYNGQPGKRNYAGGFDGSDDYFSRSSITNFPTADYTYSAWIYLNNLKNYNFLFDINDISAVYIDNTGAVSHVAASTTVTSSRLLTTGNWYHIVATRTGSTMKTYINGVADVNTGSTSTALNISGCTLFVAGDIGANCNTVWNQMFLDGKVDDFRVYNYGLTDTQIKNLYNQEAINYGPVTGAP